MRVLDLYCGGGGAGMGYRLAWPDAEIVGVDLRPMPRYPFTFVQGDALDYVREHGQSFDFIHASPPCQAYTPLKAVTGKSYPDLVAATRDALQGVGVPWIMENVKQAPLLHGAELCGLTFGLRVYRHRRFEAPFLLLQPAHLKHRLRTGAGRGQHQRKAHYLAGNFVTITGNVGTYCGPAMGITWMNGAELSQAIPPAYTAYLAQFVPLALRSVA